MQTTGSLANMDTVAHPAKQNEPTSPAALIQAIYKDLRLSTSMAAGIEAIATQAIDDGELTPEAIESIAIMAAQIKQDIMTASISIAELHGSH